jgi:hypothetical protein
MNSNYSNSDTQFGGNAERVVVCGTVAADAAAGDTMSSEVRVG